MPSSSRCVCKRNADAAVPQRRRADGAAGVGLPCGLPVSLNYLATALAWDEWPSCQSLAAAILDFGGDGAVYLRGRRGRRRAPININSQSVFNTPLATSFILLRVCYVAREEREASQRDGGRIGHRR